MTENLTASAAHDHWPAEPTATSAGEEVLVADSLVKHYAIGRHGLRSRPQVVRAVDGVSLSLRRGETLGLVGESGCGKSTLSKLLLALEQPNSGEVLLNGQNLFDLNKRSLRVARRKIQIVMQDPYHSLDPRMTVGDIVAEPFRIHAGTAPGGDERRAVRDLLDVVGLDPDHLNRYPHQFSGGQRQRIGIARAIALRPDVVVCDEPVSALDVSVQAQVLNLLARIQDEFGVAYVFIAHDLSVVRHVSTNIAVMYLGKLVEYGPADDLYAHPTHPYTQALLSAVTEPDPVTGGSQRIRLTGEIPSAIDPPSGCSFRTRCWRAEDLCATQTPALIGRGVEDRLCACHFASTPDQAPNPSEPNQ